MNFSFAFEPKESDLMRRDPRVVGAKQLVSRRLMGFVVTVGLLSGLLLLALYWYLVTLLGLQESDAQTLMFTALNLTMVFSVFSFKDLRAPIWKTRFFTNPYLFASIGFSFFGLLVAFMVEPITKILRLAPFDPMSHLGLLAGIILTNIALVEVAKFLFFPRKGGV
jgi:magnesium-transporting ATPase (P-type)